MAESQDHFLRSRLEELTERVREHEGLVRALQAGEVDAIVVLKRDGAAISRLQSDEPLYRTIVDNLPQGVATVLSDGTIVYLNAHLGRMIGSDAADLLGKTLLDVVAESDRTRFTSFLQRALTAPQETSFTFRWTTGTAPALVSAMRLPISGVDVVGLAIVDIRDQVARKAAEESSREKDELLALVSHELRTPLTSIMGWIQLLELDLADGSHVSAAMRHLKNAVMAQTKIVDDLLDLSRSEKGSLSLQITDFDLRDSLGMALSFVELQAQNKSIALNVDIPDTPLPCHGDPDRLRQVFVNLLSNAVKFTEKGDVSMCVRRDDGSVVVEVRDSGMGILPEFLPFVFEPFRRSKRADGFPGLGIGLAIARRLVEAHGGTIKATSDGANRGATFTLRLPLA
jgi:PAS domain S-box-containing protein